MTAAAALAIARHCATSVLAGSSRSVLVVGIPPILGLDRGEIAADGIAIAREAVYALLEPVGLATQQPGRLRGQAGRRQNNAVWFGKEGQDPADDLGREA